MILNLKDPFGTKRLAEKRKEIAALARKLEAAESEVRQLRSARDKVEKTARLVEQQIEAYAKESMPQVRGYRLQDRPTSTMRVVFDFEWDHWHRVPALLEEVAYRIVHEALRKCDTWRTE